MRSILIVFTVICGLSSFSSPIICFESQSIMDKYESIMAVIFFGGGALSMILTTYLHLTHDNKRNN
jgi:hypothetical protein